MAAKGADAALWLVGAALWGLLTPAVGLLAWASIGQRDIMTTMGLLSLATAFVATPVLALRRSPPTPRVKDAAGAIAFIAVIVGGAGVFWLALVAAGRGM